MAKAAKPSTELTQTVPGSVPTQNFADDFAPLAGSGLENVTSRDVIIPRLVIIQKGSPMVDRDMPGFIPEAREGDVCDVATGDLFRTEDTGPVLFLPVLYRMEWIEWAPRATKRGIVNLHTTPDVLKQCHQDDKRNWIMPNGNLIQETAELFGFNLSLDMRRCYIPMKGTQLKKARKLLTFSTTEKLRRADGTSFTPPLFYRSYELGVQPESNNDGKWYGWTVNRGPALPELQDLPDPWQKVKEQAIEFKDSILRGDVKAAQDEEEEVKEHADRSNADM